MGLSWLYNAGPWVTCGASMVLKCVCGASIALPWVSHDNPIGLSRASLGTGWRGRNTDGTHGIAMGIRWEDVEHL